MNLQGSLVRDVTRAPVGRVLDVLLDPDTMAARWLQVTVDLDRSTVLVPASAVSEFAPGELVVPFDSDVITSARHVGGAVLTRSDGLSLMRHYGFSS